MRDSKFLEMHRANAMRNGLLLGQFEFLKTRQEAFEGVLLRASLKDRVVFLLWPETLIAAVDGIQAYLLQESKRKLDEAAKKPSIEVVHG